MCGYLAFEIHLTHGLIPSSQLELLHFPQPFFSLCRLFFFTRTLLFFGFRLVPSFRAESNLIHSLVTKRAALLFLA